MTPDDRKYAKSHEWVKMDGDVVAIGITDHAQEQLGDITYVELPQVGTALEADGEFGVIESVKAASDLYAPVTGEVSEINGELDGTPELVNQDPYGQGWIIKLKNCDAAQLDKLLDAAAYDAAVEQDT